MKALHPSLLVLIALSGCADPEPTRQREPGGVVAQERVRSDDPSPTARPVNIGEGGTRFAACQGRGRVGNLRGAALPLRDAPFDTAKQVGSLAENAHVFVCTRSLDQQWLGVVVGTEDGTAPQVLRPGTLPLQDDAASATDGASPPETVSPQIDCGVTAPVRAKRAYDGPCLSGWVENTFVASVAR
ncbi:hypothetical protein [Blastomonas sp. AAP53]|uniref:hypothetical protein n=1 Tax=Blastomonas sp. AAP53 TaxID=1248760 RepID=UPI00126727FC|nr:hypothetical protein [Blastomonas sp. AAP53]